MKTIKLLLAIGIFCATVNAYAICTPVCVYDANGNMTCTQMCT